MQLMRGHLEEVIGLLGDPQEVTVASLDGIGSLSDWWQVFRVTQVCPTWTASHSSLNTAAGHTGCICFLLSALLYC